MYLEAIVAGNPVSRHHSHSVRLGEASRARMEILG